MIDYQKLSGKTVAITGASRGIGFEIAKLLNQFGANLLLGSRQILENKLNPHENKVLSIALDVTDEQSVTNFLDRGISTFDQIDVLINCAGTGVFSNALELSADDFDRMISVNLRGTFLTSKYFGKHMVENGSGHILNIASIAATNALPGCAGYSASKFGVLGLTKVLQTELRRKGVQVSAILPGSVNTPFWDSIDPKPDTSQMIPPEALAHQILYVMCQPKGVVIDEITIMPPMGIL